MPCAMSIAMYNKRIMAGKKATELLLVPGARHAKSFMTDPRLWEDRAFAFIEAWTGLKACFPAVSGGIERLGRASTQIPIDKAPRKR